MATDLARLLAALGINMSPTPAGAVTAGPAGVVMSPSRVLPDFSNVDGRMSGYMGGVDLANVVGVPMPDFSNVQGRMSGYMGGVDLANVTGVPYDEAPAVDGPCISGSKRLADGRVVPCSPAEMGTAAPVELAPTVVGPPAPAFVPVQPAPVAAPAAAPGAQATLCDLGLCSPGGGGRWAAGDGTTLWDRQMRALLMQETGGIDAITQNDLAGRRRDTADLRSSPEWEAQFRAALVNTRGDSAAAAAVADRAMMAATPGSSLGYAENLAANNEAAVDNFRSELLGTAAALGRPDVASPAFGVTPGYSTGGVEGFSMGPDGQPIISVFGRPFEAENSVSSYALGPTSAKSGVIGRQALTDAGQIAMQKLIGGDYASRNPIPLQQALLSIAQEAAKNPTGVAGAISPMTRSVIEARAKAIAEDPANATMSAQAIIQAATTGVMPVQTVLAP